MTNKKMTGKIYGVLCVFYIGLITTLSLTPHPPEKAEQVWDKGAHFAAYALLFLLLKAWLRNRSRLECAFYCLAYSCVLEGIQYFVPNRSFEILDILANFTGVSAGFILTFRIRFEKN